MIFVYDHMGNGSLGDYLFRMYSDPFPWKKWLEICINVARGLQHMHSSLNQILIHHLDITTDNIMLDKDWVPKFLLDINWFHFDTGSMYKDILVPSNVATIGESLTYLVSPRYYAPEHIRSGGVMKESHVYSFGVVLLDVLLYGRNALEPMLHCGHQTSVDCFKSCMNSKCIGHINNIIDPYLMGNVTPECFREFVKIINDCLYHKRIKRPSMDDVVGRLEFILELLETSGDHGSVASEDHQSEVSFKEAVYQAYNNALFNDNEPLLFDWESGITSMNPNTSFFGQLHLRAMSVATFDDFDYHSTIGQQLIKNDVPEASGLRCSHRRLQPDHINVIVVFVDDLMELKRHVSQCRAFPGVGDIFSSASQPHEVLMNELLVISKNF
ncbi:hypothetical protein Vadar_001386 [Vaccinium darrowii]|uniref:Uncharacterized protein n=1 Tax=Vaccinium darrowii TaxID=229202 RepID=A0ACB7XXK0_9ERIC|nr:hypothetical protein Vadar_001386 [Vaccinium darrowii]